MVSFQSKLTKIINNPLFYPIILLIVGLAAYGILLIRPGFYWDDWEKVYFYFLHNPGVSLQYFFERPFSAIIYLFFYPIVNISPSAWTVIAFLLRWLGVLGIYYTLVKVWPDRVFQNRWTGLFLLVFPAFLQQPAALTYSPHFLSFALFGFSLFLMVLAVKDPRRFSIWMPFSVLFGLAQFFIIEYFVGLELLRPLLLWYILSSQKQMKRKTALKRTILIWIPFFVALIVFAWFRFFELPNLLVGIDTNGFLKAGLADKNSPRLLKSLFSAPIKSISLLITLAYTDLKYLLFNMWIGRFTANQFDFFRSKIVFLAWSSAIIASVMAGIYIQKTSREDGTSHYPSYKQILFLGLVAFLAGGFPNWTISKFIAENKWSDRYALAPLVGGTILMVNILDWVIRTRFQKQILLMFLLIVSISIQVFNSNIFRRDWELQRDISWQLAWRIPSLKPGTSFLGNGGFTDKNDPYASMHILNLLFEKQVRLNQDYAYYSVGDLDPNLLVPDRPLSLYKIRGGDIFIGNTSKAVGMYISRKGGCIRLLDPVYAGDPVFEELIEMIIPLSDLSLVGMEQYPSAPGLAIFGPEPPRDWCYYFEKADLARQWKDWATIMQLLAEFESKGLQPNLGAEYLPFIEASAQTGNWSKAFILSLSAQEITPGLGATLCNNWNRFAGISGSLEEDKYLSDAREQFCSDSNR